MAFEFQESTIISICVDCAYFNAYGRLDDQTMTNDPNAAYKHRARIAAENWPWGTEFTPECGRECPVHGFLAVNADFPHVEDWLNSHPGETETDYNAAMEDNYTTARDGDTDTWFSWSSCDQCGSPLGGDREHATAWTYISPADFPEDNSE